MDVINLIFKSIIKSEFKMIVKNLYQKIKYLDCLIGNVKTFIFLCFLFY